ncbi:aminomethyl-transferring glycine dehydrogenase subunit GcvPB [Sulfolobus acidocaldarius]|uniref:glycine dehydrogenase (aminomethyl-transferring) n=4 Tax=Sulfolobus acidocaldarius TaxID=2285 RepID=Q4J916_SULAC|nr:aminomethyl-transferring glycine dehydrogenase subunit GcvPB [Sulfolobus acidocaldarius]AAY80714.1 glycine dehydrogenase [Sulfolobus acidocaldarius DSM 639]AGE71311.1 glycine dehydrogenase subunit 2 [Sulfolobus acidocaldarius N8]AGE73580.1 glycine dehydrogenase subunit 2 [Sulfolobus acidocaldarius Ron12/I]ALU30433.1 glycine dehydrogenase [Sulfolobus acidocaldarius]ALU31154.1 glycine dehydrogenase [Sulfolobus acidocaldarius]
MWRQAKWDEPLITEYKGNGRVGTLITHDDSLRKEITLNIPENLKRRNEPNLPSISELEAVRHYIRLSQMSFGVDTGFVPLGSCTMKYNPKVEEKISDVVSGLHPLQDSETVQGILEIIYEMQLMLAEITGTDICSLQVPAGSAGELAGVLMIKKYHELKERFSRDEMLVADTAHGTNPASAAMAGYKVIYIRSNKEGLVDIDLLREVVGEKTAGFMLTNPNTLGLFEENIVEIAKLLHNVDAKLYYDGANMNGILGVVRPGDMGFDIVHLNLHKTFAVPHGGGGPGAGAICAKGDMVDFLPYPIVEKKNGKYAIDYIPKHTIGKIASFYGNIGNVVRSYVYILGLGAEGLSMIGKLSTLATNYIIFKLRNVKGLDLIAPYRPRKHEVVFSAKELARDKGVTAFDIAKALLDRGFYAPTIYFPPNIEESIMIEPTETEPKEVLDSFAEALTEIAREAYNNPNNVISSPTNTAVGRIDQVTANHPSTITPTYRVYRLRQEGKVKNLQ